MMRAMPRAARLKAFAKLNLGLRVLAKRPDGYHELRTVFQTISLADNLRVEYQPSKATRIAIEGTPEIPDNLVERAARLVLEALEIHGDIRFNLNKNIPSGAGLGGGSSDAAAVLLSLPVLAGKRLSIECLCGLAAQLGSDVPFFLQGGTALGLGRGEELYPLPDRLAKYVLLVAPDAHSSTAEAYRDLSAKLTSIGLQNKLDSFRQSVWRGTDGGVENDFEEVVFPKHPELGKIKEQLGSLGARAAAMTGSGSAIFGVFDDEARLQRAKKSFPGYKVSAISFLGRAAYRSAWKRALKSHMKVDDQWPPRSLHAR
jgi:4-diphosphocytidyl-2-C-methyl-D-erythritol kinase